MPESVTMLFFVRSGISDFKKEYDYDYDVKMFYQQLWTVKYFTLRKIVICLVLNIPYC